MSDGDRHILVNDPDGVGAQVLAVAPGVDIGQKALAVRVISSLAASVGGGGIALQGARDVTAQNWFAELRTAAGVSYDARDIADRAARLLGHVTVDNASLAVTGTFFQATQPVSIAAAIDVSDRVGRLLGVVSGGANVFHVDDNAASLTVDAPVATPVAVRLSDGAAFFDPRDVSDRAARLLGVVDKGKVWDGTNIAAVKAASIVAAATDPAFVVQLSPQSAQASTLHVTGTAAVNTAVTVTLPAAGAGLFHYITSIQIVKLYSVIGVAAGAGVLITSTNLPGNPIWTTEQLASAAGTATKVLDYQPTTPLKSSAANTATTIVAPLQLQTIWRINVSYYTAP